MRNTPKSNCTVRGAMMSSGIALHMFFFLIVIFWLAVIGFIPLIHAFPGAEKYDWLLLLPAAFLVLFFPLYLLTSFCTVTLKQDQVIVQWLGITVRTVPVSAIQLFCAVGNDREDVLCLSCRTVEDLARLQEERLLRSPLLKHELAFRKRKADWQETFAREYLNYQRNHFFAVFRKRDTVMIKMHPATQYWIQNMYPQIPYRNYTGVHSIYAPRFSYAKENKTIGFPWHFSEYDVSLEEDGIHIFTKKKKIAFLPAQEIKTLTHVDMFIAYDKHTPHHTPMLVVSCLPEEELARRGAQTRYGNVPMDVPDRVKLLAMTGAADTVLGWKPENGDCCVLYSTEKNLKTILSLYANIQINGIGKYWMEDRNGMTDPQ